MTHPLIAALTDAAGSRALAEVLADFLLAQPMGRLIRAERVLDQLDRVLDERLMERATGAHLRPAIDREIARAKARGDVVGDWLTAEAKAELRSLAGRPIRIDRRMVERVVKQDEVKELIRQVVKDTLERFLTTVKTGGDDGGGAVGSLGRKAFGFANRASAGVLGSLGSALEGRLTSAMNTFVAHNLDGVLDKVARTARGSTGLRLFAGSTSPVTSPTLTAMKLTFISLDKISPTSTVSGKSSDNGLLVWNA